MAQKTLNQKPITAFVLMLVGGLFIILGGLSSFLLTAVFRGLIDGMMTHMYGFGGYGYSFAVLGLGFGLVIVYAAFKMDSKNIEQVKKWSTVGLICSVLSLLDFGGYGIGFLLSLVGSIIALMAK